MPRQGEAKKGYCYSVWQGKRLSREMKAQRLQEHRGWDTAAALHRDPGTSVYHRESGTTSLYREGLRSSCTGPGEPLTEVFKWCLVFVDRFIEGLRFKPARKREVLSKIKRRNI